MSYVQPQVNHLKGMGLPLFLEREKRYSGTVDECQHAGADRLQVGMSESIKTLKKKHNVTSDLSNITEQAQIKPLFFQGLYPKIFL